MRPALWHPPVTPSAAAQALIKRIRRATLFVFLREHRHELFDDPFQEELATLYRDSVVGQRGRTAWSDSVVGQRGRTATDAARSIGVGTHPSSLERSL